MTTTGNPENKSHPLVTRDSQLQETQRFKLLVNREVPPISKMMAQRLNPYLTK